MKHSKPRKFKHSHLSGKELSGEFDVASENEIHIELPRNPLSVTVRFANEAYPVPCNPQTIDSLEYRLVRMEFKSLLIVSWRVASTRKVFWHARFE